MPAQKQPNRNATRKPSTPRKEVPAVEKAPAMEKSANALMGNNPWNDPEWAKAYEEAHANTERLMSELREIAAGNLPKEK